MFFFILFLLIFCFCPFVSFCVFCCCCCCRCCVLSNTSSPRRGNFAGICEQICLWFCVFGFGLLTPQCGSSKGIRLAGVEGEGSCDVTQSQGQQSQSTAGCHTSDPEPSVLIAWEAHNRERTIQNKTELSFWGVPDDLLRSQQIKSDEKDEA